MLLVVVLVLVPAAPWDLDHDVELVLHRPDDIAWVAKLALLRAAFRAGWQNRYMAQTLSEKVWDRHLVHRGDGDPDLLYVDLHLVHEVTSPQAFDGLRLAGRTVRRPDLTVATMDHNVPTTDIHLPVRDPISAKQMQVLAQNCEEFGIRLYAMGNPARASCT